MYAYLIRRLLLMIPTFFGILVINFGVLRLQGLSFTEALSGGLDSSPGERKIQGSSSRLENLLDRFRAAGNDLPALLNLNGFLTKTDMVAWLKKTAPDSGLETSKRNQLEKSLWLVGPFAVQPLTEVLADPTLSEYTGPASLALTLCAYTTVSPLHLPSQDRLQFIAQRNRELRTLSITYRQEPGKPFQTTDPEAANKQQALLALLADPANGSDFSQASRWSAILMDTGFTNFMVRLATGDLWSESKKEGVFAVIGRAWSTTLCLNVLSIVLAWAFAIPLGIRSARRLGSLEDGVTTNLLFLLWSLPSFFVGALLLHYFCTSSATSAAWFPNKGLSSDGSLWFSTPQYLMDLLWHGFLPLLTLSYASFVSLSRYLRGNLLEQFSADYVRTARSKGVSEDDIVYKHAFRNSSLTLITLSSGLLAELFGGVLIVEMIFSIPGLGSLMLDAAKQQDAPLLMASTVLSVGLLLVGILLADVLYAVVDPRIRSRYG